MTASACLRHDEHAGQPRRQVWPRIEIVADQTCRADRLIIDQQDKGLRWPGRGGRCGDTLMDMLKGPATLPREFLPQPPCDNRHEIGPIGGPDDYSRHSNNRPAPATVSFTPASRRQCQASA